ncbi:pyridoxal kinase [Xinfangfangia sp. D13-10-4-6]|uniref:pyridoxal kinase n=1 Tax=Pseudogemmobacter hezensis TaxID=2737662 RepID=UPI001557D37B|nr:pyridoxal kinase [Pseudogemmobacter hezensis]NPD13916.1 pyridoxal kinase [Pseudogemmobacter hezensis]
MQTPPLIISVQSQVVFGHVGNSAALFPLCAAGLEVAAIPTVVFSNTPDYPTLRGRALPEDFFADLLLGAEERGLPGRAAFIMTGYIGSAAIAEQAAAFIARAKASNPALIYLCDPVIGDAGPGRYVPEAVVAVIRDALLPLADLCTPNPFELTLLSGQQINSLADLGAARAGLNLRPEARVVATGCVLADSPEGCLESVIVGPETVGPDTTGQENRVTGSVSRHPAPQLPLALSGTGDLFSALIVASLAKGRPLEDAVVLAQKLTAIAMREAEALGRQEVMLTNPAFLTALSELAAG